MNSKPRGRVLVSTLLLVVLAGLIGAGVYMLDRLGVVRAREMGYRMANRVPYLRQYVMPRPMTRTERKLDRLRAVEARLVELRTTIDRRENALDDRTDELEAFETRLTNREQELDEREQALSQQEDERTEHASRVEYLAGVYGRMKPARAAERLEAIETDPLVIDILRSMDDGRAGQILSRMSPERSARLSERMISGDS